MHGIVHEALAFPVKVVVMRDDGVTRLGDELGNGQAQRQVERNGQGILDDQRFQMELLREFIKLFLEGKPQLVDLLGDVRRADVNREEILMEFLDLRMSPAPFVQ